MDFDIRLVVTPVSDNADGFDIFRLELPPHVKIRPLEIRQRQNHFRRLRRGTEVSRIELPWQEQGLVRMKT